jgi:hypothetical protein
MIIVCLVKMSNFYILLLTKQSFGIYIRDHVKNIHHKYTYLTNLLVTNAL